MSSQMGLRAVVVLQFSSLVAAQCDVTLCMAENFDNCVSFFSVGRYIWQTLEANAVTTVRSMKVAEGCKADLWQTSDLTGDGFAFYPGEYNFDDLQPHFGGENKVQSMIIAEVCKVTTWKHGVENGEEGSFGPGSYDKQALEAAGVEDNSVTAIRVQEGCMATLFDGPDFTGTRKSFNEGTFGVKAHGFGNDILSSMIVTEVCVRLFEYQNMDGWSAAFGPGTYDEAALNASGVPQSDEKSEVKVFKGCKATLRYRYGLDDDGGRAFVYYSGVHELKALGEHHLTDKLKNLEVAVVAPAEEVIA